MKYLDTLTLPYDIKQLSLPQLQVFSDELRAFLIESVLTSGGHFASGLGVVELTVALHYVFNSPYDPIVWDVGHQAYPHKILTGRKNEILSIRQKGGLTPFPSPFESDHDAFSVGHSSTSISAALGMSIAKEHFHENSHPIAVIGDGALTAGLAFEALNHAGALKADILVILNDNNMSISPNVGAVSNMLTRTLSNPTLQKIRTESAKLIEMLPFSHALDIAKKTEGQIKSMVSGGSFFEELEFQYFGPIDGHDLPTLVTTLQNLKAKKGPKLLHIVTKKGKGYLPAENAPVKFHAVSPKVNPLNLPQHCLQFTQVFSKWICEVAEKDPDIMAITPAMCEGSGLVEFQKRFPDRFFDVAIAEQHAVTLAAGMAIKGLKPIVAIYSTFLQRAYDQLIHDVALQNLPVLFAIDRAGMVGPDGPTHIGAYDLAYLRPIPNMVIMAPSDENECYHMLSLGLELHCPVAVRYPKAIGTGANITESLPLSLGKAHKVRQGEKILIIAVGIMLSIAQPVADNLNATLIDLRFIKPIDHKLITEEALTHNVIITIEDGTITGGAGSAIQECLNQANIFKPIKFFGIPDQFIEHGERSDLLKMLRLSSPEFEEDILKFVNEISRSI